MHESIGHSVGRFDFAGALLAGAGGSCLMWAFVDLGEGQIGLDAGRARGRRNRSACHLCLA